MRFTTYRYDPVLGKHFALARFYDGVNGRMMSKDPVKRGMNPYHYCDNDPVNYEDSTGEILHILGAAGVGGLLGAGAAALDSIVSQALNGEKIDWREVGGSAIDGGIIGAAQAGLLASGAGVPAALLVDFLAGTTGSAAKQYYVDGKIDAGESITRGLTNAVGQLPYNIKGIDKLKKLSDVGKEALKGGLAGAGEAGIRYITDHIGKDPAQVRMGTGLLPAIAGNFTPRELLRDPKRGCGSESPFTPGLGYHSARGYRYDVPRISESKSNKASLGGFLKETALGGLMGGLASAAFYKVGKGLDKLAESLLPKKEHVLPKIDSGDTKIYSPIEYDGSVKVNGEIRDVSRRIYQRNDININYFDENTGMTNLERMKAGKPPIGSDGNPIQLHHILQKEVGPMVEIQETTHQQYYTQLHGLIGDGASFRNDSVLNKQYNNFRYNYWKWRADQF